jgi:hypothetical protein
MAVEDAVVDLRQHVGARQTLAGVNRMRVGQYEREGREREQE